jgi:ATP-dependent Clp protease ATP-binding subunit ClpA
MVCKFNKLDTLSIKKIVVKFTEDLKKSLLEKHNITLNLSEPVIEYLAEQGYDSKMGARPLARKIDELVRVPLSKKILFERVSNANVMAVIKDNEIAFNITNKQSARVGEDGIIQVEHEPGRP